MSIMNPDLQAVLFQEFIRSSTLNKYIIVITLANEQLLIEIQREKRKLEAKYGHVTFEELCSLLALSENLNEFVKIKDRKTQNWTKVKLLDIFSDLKRFESFLIGTMLKTNSISL